MLLADRGFATVHFFRLLDASGWDWIIRSKGASGCSGCSVCTPSLYHRVDDCAPSAAGATLVAFMGIGVVGPILPLIDRAMGATRSQVEWLFTSYIAVMALAMLVSGVLATRLGGKRTPSWG